MEGAVRVRGRVNGMLNMAVVSAEFLGYSTL
jgi:hypothetical protein